MMDAKFVGGVGGGDVGIASLVLELLNVSLGMSYGGGVGDAER